jgi:hypothetical protein
MNHDDPKLTAYALDALSQAERAEIETLLKEQPSAATEVEEVRETAGIMRQLFRTELDESLQPHRRDAILRAACLPVALPQDVSSKIITHPSWWRRAAVWQAAAACAVFGFGVYAISVTLTKPSGGSNLAGGDTTPGIAVNIPSNGEVHPGAEANGLALAPETKSKNELEPIAGGPLPGAPILPTVKPANIAEQLKVPNDLGKPRIVVAESSDPLEAFRANAKGGASHTNSERLPKNDGKNLNTADSPRVGTPVYAATNSGETNLILPGDTNPVTLSAAEASRFFATQEYLNARWQEASGIREGNTYADLARNFRRDGGSAPKSGYRFVLIRCPFIKLDVEFAAENDQAVSWPIPQETQIRKVSRPYFEPENGK